MISSRLSYIDALRGWAIIGVVLVHCSQLCTDLPSWLGSISGYGGMGVELFFLLSALTLTTVYADQVIDARAFMIRRIFRIAPMFYFGMFSYLFLYGFARHEYAPAGIGFHQIILTMAFLHGWWPDSFNAIVPGGWSIGDEAMFYLIFPALLSLIRTLPRAFFFFALACLVSRLTFVAVPRLLGHDPLIATYTAFLFPTQITAFAGGLLSFHLITAIRTVDLPKLVAPSVSLACLITLFVFGASGNKSLMNYLLADIIFIPLVVAIATRPVFFISNYVTVALGKISFSVYIVHFAVLHFVSHWLLPATNDWAPTGQLVALFVLVLLVSAVISAGTYSVIEKPGTALGRRLSQSLKPRGLKRTISRVA